MKIQLPNQVALIFALKSIASIFSLNAFLTITKNRAKKQTRIYSLVLFAFVFCTLSVHAQYTNLQGVANSIDLDNNNEGILTVAGQLCVLDSITNSVINPNTTVVWH